MADYQFEVRLRNRADEFVQALKTGGIEASIVDDSIREYSLKVSISTNKKEFGLVAIYYSPKSDSFSMKTNELRDKSITVTLERYWKETPMVSVSPALLYQAYVDGSFINGATGYGVVILADGQVVEELSGKVDPIEVNGSRQVAGELAAVKAAINWCVAHSVTRVSIYYDYLGIEKWATGQWKTNQPLTQAYAQFVAKCQVKVQWNKVASHTGDRWNDRADFLAKQGAISTQSSGGQAGIAPAGLVPGDLISDLIKKTDAWIEFLMVRGIEARFDRIYNDQFARVYIVQQDKPVGTFDLYNTKKKRFSPYLHNFRDEAIKLTLEGHWKTFLSS